MAWMIFIPMIAAALAPWLHRLGGPRALTLLVLAPASVAAGVVWRLPLEPIAVVNAAWPWVPELGISFALRFDGLAATLALLIAGIGTLILLYAIGYMHTDARLGRLVGLLLFFMSAMLGLVLSDDLFTLFVFWELTSVASYLLIGFKHDNAAARNAARQALLVTGAGGLALLAGFVLLTLAALQSGIPLEHASRISTLVTTDLSAHGFFVPALLLVAFGAFAKSAQAPLHFWLPNAMTAPTPVSAYLHSATMVKAGVFLLARLNPVFGESAVWHGLLTTVGAVTMLLAAAMSVGQTDLKRILAYTTVSVLGTLTMLIGVGTDLAIKAAVVYLVAHACYKAALFMLAGSLEHVTGTRDVRKLGGLFRAMPLTATAGLLAALSMAGAPPLFGFIGKELLLKAKLNLETWGIILIFVASASNMFLVAMALVVAVWPFHRRTPAISPAAHEVTPLMWLGPLVLGIAGLFVGVVPGAFDHALGSATASSIGGREIIMKLKLWHGLSPMALTALGISALTLAAGFALFLQLRNMIHHAAELVGRIGRYGPAQLYEALYENLLGGAERFVRHTQTGSLRGYVGVALVVLVGTSVYPLMRSVPFSSGLMSSASWYELVILVLIVSGGLAAAVAAARMTAVALLGVSGLLVAVVFALFSAPDLAITQILVEALTVILLVLVFHGMPQLTNLRSRGARFRDAGLALAAGATVTSLLIASTAVHLPATVSQELSELSKPAAYGRNIVNVILVDFRALDTLGEITVVAVAGLGVYALARGVRRRRNAETTA